MYYFWVLDFKILLLFTFLVHHGQISIIIDIEKGQLVLDDDGNIDIVGRRSHILVILLGEDVRSDNNCLSVTVLSSFGGCDRFYLFGFNLANKEKHGK